MRRVIIFVCAWVLCLSAVQAEDTRALLDAYLHNDMPIWKAYIDSLNAHDEADLLYEYGYCGAMMAEDKEVARPYVERYRQHVEAQQHTLPAGHYEMYMSAVYVYELRLHESFHPTKSLSLAHSGVKKAPNDPLVLSYCGTALFYAPAPFGNKKEALECFLKAEQLMCGEQWYDCWVRPATMMYIAQCYDKQGNKEEARKRAPAILQEYPEYGYIRDTFLPSIEP